MRSACSNLSKALNALNLSALVLTAAVAFAPLPAAAQSDFDAAFSARLEKAAIAGDKPTLQDCRSALLKLTADAKSPVLPRYALAYTDWRLENLKSKEDKTDYLKEAQKLLEGLVAAEPANAEARSLLGGVIGRRISDAAWQAPILGPKAGAALDRALKDGPNNPRVAIQRAISAFYTPEAFGGSLANAENEARRALTLFAAEPPNQPWPNWGRLDALAWLGQILEKKGDLQGARTAYSQALAIDPSFGWVRYLLLPALERKLATH